MRKRIITLSLAMFALVAAQNVNAAEMAQQLNTDIEHIDKVTKDRPGDKQFKFEKDEISFDITSAEELVLPKLLNPHELKVTDVGISVTEAFPIFEVDDSTKEITKYEVNRAYMGDVILYASAEKSSKYGPSSAQCVIHFYDPTLVETINFTSDDWDDMAAGVGKPHGWEPVDSGYYIWHCGSGGMGAYGGYRGISSYVEEYVISPEMLLEGENCQYSIELINTIYDFGEHKDWARVKVREVGTSSWIDLGDLNFPDPEGSKYAKISSGKLPVPVELTGKNVQFAFMYATDGTTIGNWNIVEVRFYKEKVDPTGIGNVEVENEINDNKIYDLQGRVVNNPAHGIYIMNGRKFVVR